MWFHCNAFMGTVELWPSVKRRGKSDLPNLGKDYSRKISDHITSPKLCWIHIGWIECVEEYHERETLSWREQHPVAFFAYVLWIVFVDCRTRFKLNSSTIRAEGCDWPEYHEAGGGVESKPNSFFSLAVRIRHGSLQMLKCSPIVLSSRYVGFLKFNYFQVNLLDTKWQIDWNIRRLFWNEI